MKNSDDLKQLKELLEIVKHKVDTMNTSVTAQLASFMVVKEQQSVMNEKLDDVSRDLGEVKKTLAKHTRTLTQHTDILTEHTDVLSEHTDLLERRILPSVIETETTIRVYADAYKTNKANIERLDERVTRFEDKEDYIVPSNLVIHR